MIDSDELRRRLGILKQKLDDGKIVIAEHLADNFKESFEKVRYDAGGNIDLSTVDSRVRSMAMAMAVAMMDDRDQVKSAASLSDIQHAYFERITAMFGQVHDMMIDKGKNPQSFSWALSRDDESVEKNYPLIDDFVSELHNFWEIVSDPVRYHLQDMDVLKGVFGGDLFPSYEKNLASSTGLYLDTIVLTDPFMNTESLFSRWSKRESVRMFLKHGLQLMNYKDLALADLDIPIVVILPFESSHNEDYRKSLFSSAEEKALRHGEIIFGRKFSDVNDFNDFLKSFPGPRELSDALADSSRLLFDTEWSESPEEQISRAMKEFSPVFGNTVGDFIYIQCFGRMSQATDITWKALSLRGVPLIDAPTSWKYYNWSSEYDAEVNPEKNIPLHVTRGIQQVAEHDMQWIGNIPPESLIEIRKEGALEDIRTMISTGVSEIMSADSENFFREADKIYDNLEAAFSDHQKRIDELRGRKWKFAGRDIGSWVVAGSIEVAAALSGTPPGGLPALLCRS